MSTQQFLFKLDTVYHREIFWSGFQHVCQTNNQQSSFSSGPKQLNFELVRVFVISVGADLLRPNKPHVSMTEHLQELKLCFLTNYIFIDALSFEYKQTLYTFSNYDISLLMYSLCVQLSMAQSDISILINYAIALA